MDFFQCSQGGECILPIECLNVVDPSHPLDDQLGSFRQVVNLANPPTSYRSLSGPPGPKSPKSLKKVSRGLRPLGPKKSGKSLEKVRKVWKKSRKCLFGTFSRLFPDFLGPRGRRPRETFFRLFGDFLARRARETPVARRRVRKVNPFHSSDLFDVVNPFDPLDVHNGPFFHSFI